MQRVKKKQKKPKTDLKLDVVFLPYKTKIVLNKPPQVLSRASSKKRSRPQDTYCVPMLDDSSVFNSQESLGFFDSQDAPALTPAPSPTCSNLTANGDDLSQLSLSSCTGIAGPLSPSLSVLSPLTQQASPPVGLTKRKGGFLSKKRRNQHMLKLSADALMHIESAWDTMCASQARGNENVMKALSTAIASAEELREQLK